MTDTAFDMFAVDATKPAPKTVLPEGTYRFKVKSVYVDKKNNPPTFVRLNYKPLECVSDTPVENSDLFNAEPAETFNNDPKGLKSLQALFSKFGIKEPNIRDALDAIVGEDFEADVTVTTSKTGTKYNNIRKVRRFDAE